MIKHLCALVILLTTMTAHTMKRGRELVDLTNLSPANLPQPLHFKKVKPNPVKIEPSSTSSYSVEDEQKLELIAQRIAKCDEYQLIEETVQPGKLYGIRHQKRRDKVNANNEIPFIENNTFSENLETLPPLARPRKIWTEPSENFLELLSEFDNISQTKVKHKKPAKKNSSQTTTPAKPVRPHNIFPTAESPATPMRLPIGHEHHIPSPCSDCYLANYTRKKTPIHTATLFCAAINKGKYTKALQSAYSLKSFWPATNLLKMIAEEWTAKKIITLLDTMELPQNINFDKFLYAAITHKPCRQANNEAKKRNPSYMVSKSLTEIKAAYKSINMNVPKEVVLPLSF